LKALWERFGRLLIDQDAASFIDGDRIPEPISDGE
jgi:hypothetical protein